MQTAAPNTETVNSGIHEQETKSIAQGAGLVFAGRVIGGSLQYLYILIVAKVLGDAAFGSLMLGMAVVNLAGIVARLGMDVGVIRYIAIHHGQQDKAAIKGTIIQSFAVSFAISLVIAGLLFVFAEPFCVTLFHKPELAQLVRLLSVSIPFFTVMTIALSATRGFHIMKYTVYGQDMFFPVCNIIFASILLLAGCTAREVAGGYVVAVFLASLLSLYFLMKVFPSGRDLKASYNPELLGFSLPLMFTVLLHSIVIWTDTLMLGRFRPADDVGVYSVCAKTAVLTGAVLVAFNTIFTPMASGLYKQQQTTKLGDMFKLITRWIYSISLPFFLLIVLLSPHILAVFGDDYIAGKYALIILALAQLVFAGTGSTAVMLAMSGRQYIVLFNTIGVCVLNITLNLWLIRPYGIIGAAAATGISIMLSNLLMLVCVRKILGMHPYSCKFLKITLLNAAAFAAAAFVAHLMHDFSSIQKITVVAASYLLFYVGLCMKWAFYDEDRFIIHLLKTRLKAGTAL